MAKHEAEANGCDDALMLDWRGQLAEGTGANLFLAINGELHTPTPDCFLNGLTRQTVIGLFPMRRRRGRIELWHHPYCYLTAPLLRRGCERAAISAWLDWVRTQAATVRLEDVPGDGPVRLHLVEALYQRGWTSLVTGAYARALLRRAPTAEHFLSRALAGKRRKELRRQRSRLAEQGRLSVEELPPGEDPRAFIGEFLALEAAGWKGTECATPRRPANGMHSHSRNHSEKLCRRSPRSASATPTVSFAI